MTLSRRALPLVALSFVHHAAQADTELRKLDGFTEIGVSSGIGVTLVQGTEFRVEVEADDTDDIVTEVVGDTLRIYKDSGWKWYDFGLLGFFMDDDELHANVTLPTLTRIRSSGGADVHGQGTFNGDKLELRTSGGGNITLTLDYDAIDVRSSGGSTMHLAGTANRGILSSSGGSRQNNEDLTVKEAELRSSGGSNLNVGEVEELSARASGGSDIRYEGNPRIRDIDESGGADVTRR